MLPERFCARMNTLLGAEYPAFLAAMEGEAERALHVNTAKIKAETLSAFFSGALVPMPYGRDAFYFRQDKIGLHPLHRAGAFYVQDPGAMATVAAAPVQRGFRVADLCAAPGGKSSQLSLLVGEEGFLLSNEYNLARCRILSGNTERLGHRNTVLTQTDIDTLAGLYPAFFDLVLVDAPCSGEGMFRKYGHAGEEWSEGEVLSCAERQAGLLHSAAGMVRGGGYLLYSTCTFSLEENEMTVDGFLRTHTDFTVEPVCDEVCMFTAPGVAFPGAANKELLPMARRFYPHKAKGEGQFLCLLRKDGGRQNKAPAFRDAATLLNSEEMRAVSALLGDTLTLPEGYVLRKANDRILLLREGTAVPPRFTYTAGVTLGELRKGRIAPHHQFFSAFGADFYRKIDLKPGDETLDRYLRGETFSCSLPEGYAVVTVAGCALGGVKVTGGVAKNHYPKGLRG